MWCLFCEQQEPEKCRNELVSGLHCLHRGAKARGYSTLTHSDSLVEPTMQTR
jgi:hypothetical protein